MTKQYGFVVDVSRCTGCRTCAVACKDAHNLPVGLNLRRVLEEASGSWRQDRMTGAWHQDVRAWYVSIACNHCENPACVKVCPTKAHYKRAETYGDLRRSRSQDALAVHNVRRSIPKYCCCCLSGDILICEAPS